MKRIITLLKNSKLKSRRSFLLILFIPVVIAVFFYILSNYYYIRQHRNTLITNYTNEINKLVTTAEDSITSLNSEMMLMSSISEIQTVSSTALSMNELSYDMITNAQSSLYAFRNECKYLDNIAIVNRSSNFVLSSRGLSSMSKYFKEMYNYADYNFDFWESYNTGNGTMRILSPTTVSGADAGNSHSVIPIILPVIGASQTSLILFDVNPSVILQDFCNHTFTEHTMRYMIDVNTGENINQINAVQREPDIKLTTKLKETNFYYIGDLSTDDGKSLIISSQAHSNIFPYRYVVEIPYSDISNQTYASLAGLYFITLIMLLCMLTYTFAGSKVLAKPWYKLAKKLNNGKDFKRNDVVEYVTSSVSHIIDDNSNLQHSLHTSLTYSRQKYLIELLNNSEKLSDPYMDKAIFKYDLFSSVIINISLSGNTEDMEYEMNRSLYAKMYNAVESVFASKFETLSLPWAKNTLYLILNLESDNCDEAIDDTIDEIRSLFIADENYISIYVGRGGIYQGISGLRRSHTEALSSMSESINAKSSQLDFDNMQSKMDIANIADYINEHYTENLYLDMLAVKFNTTPKYLSKVIKQQLGIPFKSYLTQLRISKAEELLLSDEVKITDLYSAVGFSSHASFIRSFKQKNGVSPSEYRKLHTNN